MGMPTESVDSCSAEVPVAPAPGRVLVLAPQPFYEDRGTPIAISYVLRALSDLGWRVDLLTLPMGQELQVPNLEILRLPNPLRILHVPVGLSCSKLFFDALLTIQLRRQLNAVNYTCIHAVEEAVFPALWLGRRRRIPVVYDMQSSLPEQLQRYMVCRAGPIRRGLHLCERWVLSNATAVISSSGLAASTRRAVPQARVTEWFFPCHTKPVPPEEVQRLRQTLALESEERTVVYAGTFSDYQGLDSLLAAIPTVVAEYKVVFVLVGGTTSETAALNRRLAAMRLRKHVRLLERQPRESISSFLAMADVLISTRSYGGNLPLKIFDYIAAGRPIVATDIASHRSVLNNDCAFLVEPTVRGIAAGILEVLRDPKRAETVIANARRHAEEYLATRRFGTS